MELIFIGTGSGRTSLNRFHSSLLFKDGSQKILVDCGDGISRALLTQNISVNLISDIIITHYHSDHLAGLTSLITQMIIQSRKSELNIFTHIELVDTLNLFMQTNYIFKYIFDFSLNNKLNNWRNK